MLVWCSELSLYCSHEIHTQSYTDTIHTYIVVYVRKYVGSSSSAMADDVSTSILVKRPSISRDCLWLLILEILKIAQEILYLWHSNVSFFLYFQNKFCCRRCNFFRCICGLQIRSEIKFRVFKRFSDYTEYYTEYIIIF